MGELNNMGRRIEVNKEFKNIMCYGGVDLTKLLNNDEYAGYSIHVRGLNHWLKVR